MDEGIINQPGALDLRNSRSEVRIKAETSTLLASIGRQHLAHVNIVRIQEETAGWQIGARVAGQQGVQWVQTDQRGAHFSSNPSE